VRESGLRGSGSESSLRWSGSGLRVLITGASGFAGRHLALRCARAGDEVIGLSRSGRVPAGAGEGRAIDLRDAAAVAAAVREAEPEVVYHLAALSSVGRSWEDPATTVKDNVSTAVNVLEALALGAPRARVVWVSSCEVYGVAARLPIEESAPVAPANPYAVSKATGDLLAGVYADARGLDLVRARPFNHAGPGQLPIFIVSSLAQQAAKARIKDARKIRIVTGNPDARRDFTDVRDIARAYRLLAQGPEPAGAQGPEPAGARGAEPAGARGAEPAIYNVCSGRSVSAAEQVRLLGELIAPIAVEHVVDPERVRAREVMELRGAHDRLSAATGWEPEIPLRQTMADAIDWWEAELAGRPDDSKAT